MTMREATLSPICLYPDGNVAKALEVENFLWLCSPREGDKEQGEDSCCSLGRLPTGRRHLFDTDYFKSQGH
jgi:hypothetical protein